MDYTLGPQFNADPYHVDVIRNKLTRALPLILPEVIDELGVVIPKCIPAKGDGESTHLPLPFLLCS